MNVITIDFETFWSKEHTLRKMSPIDYVMHSDTDIICTSAKLNGEPTEAVLGEGDSAHLLKSLPWSKSLVIGHNMSEFDSMILAWRFGVKPAMWGCTLAMARPIHAKTTGLGLGVLVKHYGLGVKDNTVLLNTQGRRLQDFTKAERAAMLKYNKEDTDQCYALFRKLAKHYNSKELSLIDMTIRALVEPVFSLDQELLSRTLVQAKTRTRLLLRELASKLPSPPPDGEDVVEWLRSELASAPKFSALMKSLDVPVPTKPSPTSEDKRIPALSKTDQGFLALLEHPDERVRLAAAARLDVKSVLLESRIEALQNAQANSMTTRLPIPLKYCGADTTGRWSGFLYNPQNLPRINTKEPKLTDALRMSLRAPKGMKVVVADLSGIELRVNHFLWKVEESMALYAADATADLYVAFAADRYGIPESEVSKLQRQLAKVAQLGLGFGASYLTFQQVAKIMSGGQLDLTVEESADVVAAWRQKYERIVKGWSTCHAALDDIVVGHERFIDPWGLTHTCAEGIRLPSGRIIRYPDLRSSVGARGRKEWVYGSGRHIARIYAGKIDENIVQALARDVIAGNALEVRKTTGFSPALMVHDELAYVVPEGVAYDLLTLVQQEMRKPPIWWPELVTWSEGDVADTYGSAK